MNQDQWDEDELNQDELDEFKAKAIKAIEEGSVAFANPHAKEAMATLHEEVVEGQYNFIDVTVEPFSGVNPGILFLWACRGVGFGELTFYYTGEQWHCHTEHM